MEKLLLSVDATVGLEIFATTLAEKHMANVLPTLLLFLCLKRLDSLVTDITRPYKIQCTFYFHRVEKLFHLFLFMLDTHT